MNYGTDSFGDFSVWFGLRERTKLCAGLQGDVSLKGKGEDGWKWLLVTFASFYPCLDAGLAPPWCKASGVCIAGALQQASFLTCPLPCSIYQPVPVIRFKRKIHRGETTATLCLKNPPSHPRAKERRKPQSACVICLTKPSCFLQFTHTELEMVQQCFVVHSLMAPMWRTRTGSVGLQLTLSLCLMLHWAALGRNLVTDAQAVTGDNPWYHFRAGSLQECSPSVFSVCISKAGHQQFSLHRDLVWEYKIWEIQYGATVRIHWHFCQITWTAGPGDAACVHALQLEFAGLQAEIILQTSLKVGEVCWREDKEEERQQRPVLRDLGTPLLPGVPVLAHPAVSLLCCIGKLLQKLLRLPLSHWAPSSHILSPCCSTQFSSEM